MARTQVGVTTGMTHPDGPLRVLAHASSSAPNSETAATLRAGLTLERQLRPGLALATAPRSGVGRSPGPAFRARWITKPFPPAQIGRQRPIFSVESKAAASWRA